MRSSSSSSGSVKPRRQKSGSCSPACGKTPLIVCLQVDPVTKLIGASQGSTPAISLDVGYWLVSHQATTGIFAAAQGTATKAPRFADVLPPSLFETSPHSPILTKRQALANTKITCPLWLDSEPSCEPHMVNDYAWRSQLSLRVNRDERGRPRRRFANSIGFPGCEVASSPPTCLSTWKIRHG